MTPGAGTIRTEPMSVTLRGVSAAPGFASGRLIVQKSRARPVREAGSPETEAAALRNAISAAATKIAETAATIDGDAADILGFQIAMLEDDALIETPLATIANGTPADLAWQSAMGEMIAEYTETNDEYFRARAADLQDLRDAVLDAFFGGDGDDAAPRGILLADDLAPSLFLARDWDGCGIALRRGSPTSHVAILARARQVPMVVGLGDVPFSEETVLLDADGGLLTIDPCEAERADFEARQQASATNAQIAADAATSPGRLADGTPVAVLINVADPSELDHLDPEICDGIGLARTELMFHSRDTLPGEDEQFAAYVRLVQWAAPNPVIIRTLDAGGDKPIPGYTLDDESNPFLGIRGVRLSLRHPDVFRIQIRALLRAGVSGALKAMIPMVSRPDEMTDVRALFREEAGALDRDGVPHAMPEIGMMVETPAAAYTLERYDVDFVSIGSNDLAQYMMAAGRDAPETAEIARADDPAVLDAIKAAVRAATARGIPISLCGDAGGDPAAAPLLIGCGLRALSVAPTAVGRLKQVLSTVQPFPAKP